VKGPDLPSDEVIAEALPLCKTPGWRVVYILIAVFGLRDHEVLKCQFNRLDDDPPLIEVPEKTKTGARLAYACFGDCWGDEFRIRSSDIVLPKVKNIETSSNLHLGRKVAQEFYECGVTAKVGKVYNLRHAWARRAFEHEWPVELVARAMGHD
jgi:integrase